MVSKKITSNKLVALIVSFFALLNATIGAIRFTPGYNLNAHYPRYIVIHPFMPGTDFGTSWVPEMINTLGRGSGISRLGFVGVIFTLQSSDAIIEQQVDLYFNTAETHDIALLLHLDSEHFYDTRSDLWNWWNASMPGYNVSNRDNVEWSDWDTPTTKGFLNWGSPIEFAPRLCFESAVVRAEIARKCQIIIDKLVPWLAHLDAISRSDLFLGIDPGWETGIDSYENVEWVPEADRFHLGYNALTKRGFNATNPPQDREAELAKVVHDFAEFEVKIFADQGISTNKLFTHIWGAESISTSYHMHAPFEAAFNDYSIPGFSLYSWDHDLFANAVADKKWSLMESPLFQARKNLDIKVQFLQTKACRF